MTPTDRLARQIRVLNSDTFRQEFKILGCTLRIT